jgi:hypothetical protein
MGDFSQEMSAEKAARLQTLIENHLAQYMSRAETVRALAVGAGIRPGETALGS